MYVAEESHIVVISQWLVHYIDMHPEKSVKLECDKPGIVVGSRGDRKNLELLYPVVSNPFVLDTVTIDEGNRFRSSAGHK